MDNISSLIKEAKPLYFARKRRRNIVKSTSVLLCLLCVGFAAYSPITSDVYSYYWDSEFSVSDNVSVIEEMGLPTDEYGLLLVG